MTHPDDGTLRAYLDQELPGPDHAETVVRLNRSPEFSGRLAELAQTEEVVRDALALLDVPPDLDRVWAAIEDELEPAIEPEPRRAVGPASWPGWSRAAAVVLLVGGGAAAALLPGSPLRPTGGGAPSGPSESPEVALVPESEAGIRDVGGTSALRFVVEASAGVEVVVDLVTTGSGLFAPATSTFSSGSGVLRARATEGPVRLEVDQSLESGSVELNGDEVVRVRGGRIVFAPDGAERSPDGRRVRFVAP